MHNFTQSSRPPPSKPAPLLQVTALPILQDNYVWLIHSPNEREVIAVDPGDARPVIDYLQQHQLSLAAILITHSHHDHIDGISDLLAWQNAPVIGPSSPAIPQVTDRTQEGDEFTVAEISFRVWHLPGHLPEHLAYLTLGREICQVFSGDVLFASGCGRIFRGTHEELKTSLDRLKSLPPTSLIYPTHEYTLANLRFAKAVEPDNPALPAREAAAIALREKNLPTLPTSLATELTCNPFLRCHTRAIKQRLESEAEFELNNEHRVFKALRLFKDRF